ncbi:MAG TPA: hypothetical protein VMT35_06580 [Ignavibacteriaceae bacterium]|nr:hypothetical protein [Ignavibacteriaceae bacterium]
MFKKYKNKFLILVFISIGILFVQTGCDSVLPDDFTEKNFESSNIDIKASNILSKDTTGYYRDTVSFHNNFGNYYLIKARTMLSMVDSDTRELLLQDSITESEVTIRDYGKLIDSLENVKLIRDSLMIISTDTTSNIVYGAFTVSQGQSKDFYLYTSLIFTSANLNEYASVRLIKSDGSNVSFSEDMPMEVVSSGSQEIPVAGGTRLVPTIKARYQIHADEGTYIVRFTKSNTSGFGRFIKILILSI